MRGLGGWTFEATHQHIRSQVIVSEYDGHCISVFSLHGAFLRDFGSEGTGDGKFMAPMGICVSAATGAVPELFVCDSSNHRIQVFDVSGAFLRKWGSGGSDAGQLRFPEDVKVSVSGQEVFVSDSCNNRICVSHPDGTPIRMLGGGKGWENGQLIMQRGIYLTGTATVLVCDALNDRIQELSCKDGAFVCGWGERLNRPKGIGVGEEGEMFVCDESNSISVFV